ncbi:DUF3951 domain-containing protein [Lysinibacillus sp. NPDC093712]|uniref:DUF3951 domain-containing protein n=1 Tax=Lysinibacillus sp. NPDC093712 TaxID=3390579 RepID=UPI003D0617A6
MDPLNIVVVVIGIIFIGLIIFGVYNIVVRKKKITNMYTPFDDFTRGTDNTNRNRDLQEKTKYIEPYDKDESK